MTTFDSCDYLCLEKFWYIDEDGENYNWQGIAYYPLSYTIRMRKVSMDKRIANCNEPKIKNHL